MPAIGGCFEKNMFGMRQHGVVGVRGPRPEKHCIARRVEFSLCMDHAGLNTKMHISARMRDGCEARLALEAPTAIGDTCLHTQRASSPAETSTLGVVRIKPMPSFLLLRKKRIQWKTISYLSRSVCIKAYKLSNSSATSGAYLRKEQPPFSIYLYRLKEALSGESNLSSRVKHSASCLPFATPG